MQSFALHLARRISCHGGGVTPKTDPPGGLGLRVLLPPRLLSCLLCQNVNELFLSECGSRTRLAPCSPQNDANPCSVCLMANSTMESLPALCTPLAPQSSSAFGRAALLRSPLRCIRLRPHREAVQAAYTVSQGKPPNRHS